MATKRKAKQSAFLAWWCNPKRPAVLSLSPAEVAEVAFEAGRRSVPTSKKMRKAIENLLDMLDDWDTGGFDGFGEVNDAERLVGRPVSRVS